MTNAQGQVVELEDQIFEKFLKEKILSPKIERIENLEEISRSIFFDLNFTAATRNLGIEFNPATGQPVGDWLEKLFLRNWNLIKNHPDYINLSIQKKIDVIIEKNRF